VIACVGVGSQLIVIGAHLALKAHVQRRLASIKYVVESRVRCPRCKASLTDKRPGSAASAARSSVSPMLLIGFVTFCPHRGLRLIDPYAG